MGMDSERSNPGVSTYYLLQFSFNKFIGSVALLPYYAVYHLANILKLVRKFLLKASMF
jgi:hypothetical protein